MSIDKIIQTLSLARLSTYERAVLQYPQFNHALELYAWNAQVSAAFFMPLHICEVTIRNAVAQVLYKTHGTRWPWAEGFERALPAKGVYKPRQDLMSSRKNQSHSDKVIPELNFVFWQKLFTARFDQDIWQKHFHLSFPTLPSHDYKLQRQRMHDKIDQVRKLRNRIAHHEPIFNRDLQADYDAITDLIQARCPHTAQWMQTHQKVTPLLSKIKRTQP